jgi:hypothetical protein
MGRPGWGGDAAGGRIDGDQGLADYGIDYGVVPFERDGDSVGQPPTGTLARSEGAAFREPAQCPFYYKPSHNWAISCIRQEV